MSHAPRSTQDININKSSHASFSSSRVSLAGRVRGGHSPYQNLELELQTLEFESEAHVSECLGNQGAVEGGEEMREGG